MTAEIARSLHRRGILTKLRRSAAQEVDGGCGQLRARALGPDQEMAGKAMTEAPLSFMKRDKTPAC